MDKIHLRFAMSAASIFEPRTMPLEISAEEFRAVGKELVDRIADFFEALPKRPVSPGESPSQVRQFLGAERGIPSEGSDPAELLEKAASLLFDHSLFNGHPRFWGYVTSSAAPIGALGDLLAAAVNPNVGAWPLSPMASEIEAQTIRWIAELLGYPVNCGGLLVSGGNMANFVGFWAARQAKAGCNVRTQGMAGTRMRAYCSKETHTWVEKAADLSGLGTDAIRWIPVDADMRMDMSALRRQIIEDRAAGDQPFLVVGAAGTVGTGAVDPLIEMAAMCQEFDLWLHVDGAYGGFAAMLPNASPDLAALRLADSLAVDPHKWLYAPLEAGCALVRDESKLREAFSYHPPYYHFGVEATNYFDIGPQNSRGFRALKVWLALQQAGRSGYERMLADDIRLAGALYEKVNGLPELEALSQGLSITTFRYRPERLASGSDEAESALNELNRELLTRLQNAGRVYLSNAMVQGKFALRVCIVNFRTELADLDTLTEEVLKTGRQIEAEINR
jgi:aromatic-L-amino-acid/L-tryptophan decarboxylase